MKNERMRVKKKTKFSRENGRGVETLRIVS